MATEAAQALERLTERLRQDQLAADERNRQDREASAAAEAQARAGLPRLSFEPPPAIEAGERYVMATERIWACDPAGERIYLAAVPGQWVRETYARALGLEAEAQVLSWSPA